MPYKIKLKSKKGQNFITVFEQLVRLGLYDFAELVFAEISGECLDIEIYLVTSTFLILSNKRAENYRVKTFAVDKYENALELVNNILKFCEFYNNLV